METGVARGMIWGTLIGLRSFAPWLGMLAGLVRKVTPDKVLDEVRKYGGNVLQSSLTKDAEERLQQALQQGAGATGG